MEIFTLLETLEDILENRNDILYLDKIKFKSVKDNKVDYTCEKMVEIETQINEIKNYP